MNSHKIKICFGFIILVFLLGGCINQINKNDPEISSALKFVKQIGMNLNDKDIINYICKTDKKKGIIESLKKTNYKNINIVSAYKKKLFFSQNTIIVIAVGGSIITISGQEEEWCVVSAFKK